jgi:Tfp pilus assembly protein PilV
MQTWSDNCFSRRRRCAAGLSLIEVLISSSIGLFVVAGLLTLISVVAKEQRREMINANLQQKANLLEDKITRLIRAMSGTESVVLADPIDGNGVFYKSIIIARGPSPTAREKLSYNAQTLSCAHTPNTAYPWTTNSCFTPTTVAVLRNLYFFISEKPDGAPDGTAVTVYFRMDDNAMGFLNKTNSVTRTFTATMRNN